MQWPKMINLVQFPSYIPEVKEVYQIMGPLTAITVKNPLINLSKNGKISEDLFYIQLNPIDEVCNPCLNLIKLS